MGDPVMQLIGDHLPLSFLRLYQLLRKVTNKIFGLFALGDIHDRQDRDGNPGFSKRQNPAKITLVAGPVYAELKARS